MTRELSVFLAGDNNPQIFWAYHYTVNSGLRMPAWEMEKHEYYNKNGNGAIKTGALSRLIRFFWGLIKFHATSPLSYLYYTKQTEKHICLVDILFYLISLHKILKILHCQTVTHHFFWRGSYIYQYQATLTQHSCYFSEHLGFILFLTDCTYIIRLPRWSTIINQSNSVTQTCRYERDWTVRII